MPFKPELVVLTEFGPKSPYDWIMPEALEYAPEDGGPLTVVKEGFDTDLASVPHLFTWYAPRYGLYTKAAIVHDHLCRDRKGDRFQADLVFRKAMEELGVPVVKRWVMWTAVTWATILGNLARALGLTLLLGGAVVIGGFLLARITALGTPPLIGLIAGVSLLLVSVICYVASPHRPLLPALLACYLITVPGILLLLVSLPLIAFQVLAGLLDLVTNPRDTLRGWRLWIGPLIASVVALLPFLRRRRKQLAEDFKKGSSREQRLGNLLLARPSVQDAINTALGLRP